MLLAARPQTLPGQLPPLAQYLLINKNFGRTGETSRASSRISSPACPVSSSSSSSKAKVGLETFPQQFAILCAGLAQTC